MAHGEVEELAEAESFFFSKPIFTITATILAKMIDLQETPNKRTLFCQNYVMMPCELSPLIKCCLLQMIKTNRDKSGAIQSFKMKKFQYGEAETFYKITVDQIRTGRHSVIQTGTREKKKKKMSEY